VIIRLCLLVAGLFLLIPSQSSLAAAPQLSLDEDAVAVKKKKEKKKKKKKKKRKGKKGAEEEPPPPPPDSDGDGVIDDQDKCAEQAEDLDGFEDTDGCPDPDNDGDEISDDEDSCPDEAENKDGWDDEDGCPEAAPAISPFLIDATLVDGTKVSGKVIRIKAIDEDAQDVSATEPTQLDVIVDDNHEFSTEWSNIKSMAGQKVKFMDGINCYSEGVQELGDPTTWECTLKHPTRLYLRSSEKKGRHYVLDRKLRRFDFQIEGIKCSGDSCEVINEQRGLSLYFVNLLNFVKNDEESVALMGLQKELRAMQKMQIIKASFTAID